MYDIIKSVITEGRYSLTDILKKIDTVWLQSQIDDEQKTELVTLAQENADSRFEIDVMKKLNDLEMRVRALENSGVEPPKQPEQPAEYVVGKSYYNGDEVTWDRDVYTCIAPSGVPCVWSPTDYPPYWEKKQ